MAVEHGYGRIVTDGLVLCLDAADNNSYPGSGNTWYDLSGNGNDFTLSGLDYVSTSPSHFSFIDNQGDYAYRSSTDVIGGLSDITLDMWIKLDSNPSALCFLSYATSVNNNAFLFFKGSPNTMNFWLGASSRTFTLLDTYYLDGNWHNLIFARNGTTVKIYIDGIERASTNNFFNGNIETGGTLVFGQEQDSEGGGFATSQDLPGDISSVKIYSSYFNNTQVQQNYNATKTRFGL